MRLVWVLIVGVALTGCTRDWNEFQEREPGSGAGGTGEADGGGADKGEDIINLCPDGILQGDIRIEGERDIAALEGCTTITGSLTVADTQLSDLDGLASLSSIDGNLFIRNNAVLNNIEGLRNLISIGGDLRIGYNGMLTELTGLRNLKYVGGNIVIGSDTGQCSLDSR
jgi:hypothetical protein